MYDLRFNKFVKELSKDIPIKVAYKNESRLMKLIGMILFFNKGFMDMYITTLSDTVYYPSKLWVQENPRDAMLLMAHEYVHMKDNRRLGKIAYPIMYLFPQIFAILSLLVVLSFFIPYAWLSLVFLLCAGPIPSPSRKYIELRGYKMSLYASYLYMKGELFSDESIAKSLDNQIEYYNSQFTGAAYYFMWPFGVNEDLTDFAEIIKTEDLSKSDDIYSNVTKAFKISKSEIA